MTLLTLAAALLMAPLAAQDFAGPWDTDYGPMTLRQRGDAVDGTYVGPEGTCHIQGRLAGRTLNATYQEPRARGEAVFELSADGKRLAGRWREEGTRSWSKWDGRRPAPPARADGLWDSSFGRLRLVQSGEQVDGVYSFSEQSWLKGKLEGRRLSFRYKDRDGAGEGRFDFAADWRSFSGSWRKDGVQAWQEWVGTRVEPLPGRKWLVVVEQRWEEGLAQQEYSYGEMLRAYFARLPHVKVRHRFFTDEASLAKWAREASFLAEPTAFVVSTHGLPTGIEAGERIVSQQSVVRHLRHARNVTLLHLDACLAMKDPDPAELAKAAFPVSGYATSVDWGASAVADFMYLEMVLAKNMAPEDAMRSLYALMPFSGSRQVPGAPFPSLGMRVFAPR